MCKIPFSMRSSNLDKKLFASLDSLINPQFVIFWQQLYFWVIVEIQFNILNKFTFFCLKKCFFIFRNKCFNFLEALVISKTLFIFFVLKNFWLFLQLNNDEWETHGSVKKVFFHFSVCTSLTPFKSNNHKSNMYEARSAQKP